MDIAKALSGGSRRSIGRSNDVAAHVLNDKTALPKLVAALSHEEAVVRMRAADALEKVSVRRPEWLDPFAPDVLTLAATRDEQEIRWHSAQILPRLRLNNAQRKKAVDLLMTFLDDHSRIVQAFALTALVELSKDDAEIRARVAMLVKRAAASQWPSLRARARALDKRLSKSVA